MRRTIKHFYEEYSSNTLFILIFFVIFWPFAFYLMWKNKKWSTRTRGAVTAVFIGLVVLVGFVSYNAPPYISLSDKSLASNYKTDDDYIVIAGSIRTLHNPELSINDKSVPLNTNGEFSYKLTLDEGDTDVNVVAKSDKGTDVKNFKVHRTTAAEFTERKIIAEKEAAEAKKAAEENARKTREDAINAMLTCDGKEVKADCKLDGSFYKIYIYHPEVEEKSHTETVTTYREEVSGYCTLCVDGTYSPTCATGRGACSHHGGVAQWGAPRYRNVPVYDEKTIVDSPAKEAYYEKVINEI